MHILIGFGIVVGLVAFAFGSNTAQNFARAVVYGTATLGLGAAAFLAYVIVNERRPETTTATWNDYRHDRAPTYDMASPSGTRIRSASGEHKITETPAPCPGYLHLQSSACINAEINAQRLIVVPTPRARPSIIEFDLTKDREVKLVRKCMARHGFDRDYQSECVAIATDEFYAPK